AQAYPGNGQNCGTAAVGQTVGCNFGGFPPGSEVTVTVNGTGNLTKTADSAGNIHITITLTSQTSGVLGDPVNITVQCGTNTIVATGGGVTRTGTFTESCPAAAPAAAPTSNVAFTGANIMRWSLAAAALLGIGALMVWGSRR